MSQDLPAGLVPFAPGNGAVTGAWSAALREFVTFPAYHKEVMCSLGGDAGYGRAAGACWQLWCVHLGRWQALQHVVMFKAPHMMADVRTADAKGSSHWSC